MKGFFTIRAKFLGVMSILLITCLAVYLLIAVNVFKTDKTELVFDLNRSMVSNLSTELETEFSSVSDKLRLFAILSNQTSTQIPVEAIFGENSSIVYSSLYRQNQTSNFKSYTDKSYLETYGLDQTFFETSLLQVKPIPFTEILKEGERFWNASIEGGVPLIGYGRSVTIEDSKGRPTEQLAVISYIKLDKILKILSFVKLSDISVVDQSGNVLIHRDFASLNSNSNVKSTALYKLAFESKVNLSVASITEGNEDYLGAYAKAYQSKIFVLAKASKSLAFSAVYELVSRSISFALIVITLSLLFAFLLSRSLTKPISILVSGMEKVSGGDLSTSIEVHSKDETQMLASSFNQMIRDLKQSRDELQEINRALDTKVKERTLQLKIQNQAVKEAQEALLKTTRLASAGEIAGRAAHEVLNPLTGILTRLGSMEKKNKQQIAPQVDLMKDIITSWNSDYSEGGFNKLVESWQGSSQVDATWNLWQEDIHNLSQVQDAFLNSTKSLDEDTKFLLQEGRRISKIINGMRTLSRLNSDIKTYSARKLLNDCKNIMADLFMQEEIEIYEIYDAGTDEVNIDRDEFIQAVTNLMRNSLQAMPQAPVEHKYHLKLQTILDHGKIHIQIIDNGCGVSQEYQKMLFEKQFTTKSAEEGTGLGLGISRRFIRAHGGDIEFLKSIPFTETVFKITLPLKINNSLQTNEGAA